VPGLELKIVDSEDMTIEMPQDGEAQGELLARGPWCEKQHLFLSFPYVCPEPVLAKSSLYIYKWLKSAVFRRITGDYYKLPEEDREGAR
jgi:hypothetical protein